MKFGGTSVSAAARWRVIEAQVRDRIHSGSNVLIVVSALSGVTNLLIQLAKGPAPEEKDRIILEIDQLHRDLLLNLNLQPDQLFTKTRAGLISDSQEISGALPPERHAHLLAYGELMSSAIGAQVLAELGCHWKDARNLLSIRESGLSDPHQHHLNAHCSDHADPEMPRDFAGTGQVHITQGFIARDSTGRTCLLGRGGSDSSAAYLAARLQAKVLEIWTDVPGMFSADPRVVPDARLLQQLSYSEAQELASMGARVLHPPSVRPARTHGIPVLIKDTTRPDQPGTRIASRSQSTEALVKAVVSRSNISVIEMENPAMWQQSGFLADVFTVFKNHGVSVDLIATSESTVTVSLDPGTPASPDKLSPFLTELATLTRVQLRSNLVSISLFGTAIRTILGQLTSALNVFHDRHVHMVTQSANDLNLTLVVDREHSDQLVKKLHGLLITGAADQRTDLGPSWSELTLESKTQNLVPAWWEKYSGQLCALLENRQSAYVYHLETAKAAAGRLKMLRTVNRVLYSIKANNHPALLAALSDEGLGFECVSMAEVNHVLSAVPGVVPQDILFTPNFAPREEYEQALELGITLTIDSMHPLRHWPESFSGKDVFLRVDLDAGYGHHEKVITSGAGSKFGIPIDHLHETKALLEEQQIRVTGLHTHTGSGVSDPEVWREQLKRFIPLLDLFPDVQVLDLGGGLSVPERPGQPALDLEQMDTLLDGLVTQLDQHRDIQIWLEPGRYARITQLKTKGNYNYIGLTTGMNSLIRPALYGAYHHIVNLSRLGARPDQRYRIVGPICETGDVFSESRLLPKCREGDVILIGNTGAYGRVMSSSYNLRPPAEELIFDPAGMTQA
jgi:diaminopimelate decarboxylase/aspartate kinase